MNEPLITGVITLPHKGNLVNFLKSVALNTIKPIYEPTLVHNDSKILKIINEILRKTTNQSTSVYL